MHATYSLIDIPNSLFLQYISLNIFLQIKLVYLIHDSHILVSYALRRRRNRLSYSSGCQFLLQRVLHSELFLFQQTFQLLHSTIVSINDPLIFSHRYVIFLGSEFILENVVFLLNKMLKFCDVVFSCRAFLLVNFMCINLNKYTDYSSRLRFYTVDHIYI